MSTTYDALVLVSFGGPEKPDDVMPFLESVVRGKNVPRERLLEVAEHYALFDGVSPLNAQNRALLAAVVNELREHGLAMPVYWGNRHGHPQLADTVQQMADDGVARALAFVTSAFASYPGCRQYREDIEAARQAVGPDAPPIDKIRLFYNHPSFIEAMTDRVAAALEQIPAERRDAARLLFTAHSLPVAMAAASDYERQLRGACRLVAERLGRGERWELVFQSRSGPPQQPWLGPDVGDWLVERHAAGDCADVVIAPVGLLAENMETVYDLDVEIAGLCEHLGVNMVRAATVGNHPRLVKMIRQLVEERLDENAPRLALGPDGPWPDVCPADCCKKGTDG